jgi:lipopolysaccharide/colanic/teichoic acid biosynthesis glycosyltransferase
MKNNSHDLRSDLQELNKKTGPLFKLDNDPRILPGSKTFRKYSIDELPQLINVIKGEMSIVGPRPLFEEDTVLFDENYMRRLNVLPGMTGLLQINDRNTDDFDIWFKHDLKYIENWSLYLDLLIILKTIPSMLKRKNSGL